MREKSCGGEGVEIMASFEASYIVPSCRMRGHHSQLYPMQSVAVPHARHRTRFQVCCSSLRTHIHEHLIFVRSSSGSSAVGHSDERQVGSPRRPPSRDSISLSKVSVQIAACARNSSHLVSGQRQLFKALESIFNLSTDSTCTTVFDRSRSREAITDSHMMT